MRNSANVTIVNAILSGIADARHTYAAWTRNGGYFAWAPEYLLTVSVAQSLWEWCAPAAVWPEFRLSDAVREAGRPSQQGSRADWARRADILMYRDSRQPHAIIEIKRNIDGWSKIAADVERLRTVLTAPHSSFQLGVVAFNCTQMERPESKGGTMLRHRLTRMAECADDIRLPGWQCYLSARGINFDGHEHWSAAAIVIEKSPQKMLAKPRPRHGDAACTPQAAQVPSPS